MFQKLGLALSLCYDRNMESSPLKGPILLRHLLPTDVDTLARWRYDAPYDVYDVKADAMQAGLSDPASTFRAITSSEGLVGFCSYGRDGQMPGGDYTEPATDIGIGIRPDLVGQGNAQTYLTLVIDEASRMAPTEPLRVTIAGFNARSIRAWTRQGFTETGQFTCAGSNLPFIVLMRTGPGQTIR